MYPVVDAGGGGSSRPVGLVSAPAAPSISSGGQYRSTSSAPRAVPQATQGPIQRTGRQSQQSNARPKPKQHKKAPAPPSIAKFLAGDTTYNDQTSQLMKQLEQFRTQNASQRGMVGQDFQTALKKMMDQRTGDLGNIQNDYAARGLLNSGLYTDAVGKYNTDYQNQYNDLNTGQQRSLSDLLGDLAGYQTENTASATAAKQDAIRRRAEKYGITT